MNMTRKIFIKKTALTAVAGLAASSFPNFAGNFSNDEFDKYGGWTGKKFKATGFFRVEKDKRWWLVTPEGNAFISFGVNHYHSDWWYQNYNKEYWLDRFGSQEFNDEEWHHGFRKMALNDMKTFGFNTLGVHTEAESLTENPFGSAMPYVRRYEPIILSHYKHPRHIDIFDPSFVNMCYDAARKMAAPYKDDPMLLGYCMSDLPSMTDEDAEYFNSTTWPRELRNLPGNWEGKKAWMKTIEGRYRKISDFNSVYSTKFKSWDELRKAKNWRPSEAAANEKENEDNIEFLKICVDRYYSVARETLHKFDNNHLFFGDKTNSDTDSLETIIDVTSKYVDLVCYQTYARWDVQQELLNRLSKKIDLPFINGDFNYAAPNENLPSPYGQHAKSHRERAKWMREFGEGAFSRKEIVGWHLCGIIDTWKTMPTKEVKQQQGIYSVTGEAFPEEVKVVKHISSNLYKIATKNL